jgi:hypothetical protein
LRFNISPPTEHQEAVSLIESGPETLDRSLLGTEMMVRGFLRDGWPVVVQYEAPPSAITSVTIAWRYPQVGRQVVELANADDGTRQTVLFEVRAPTAGADVGMADFVISARARNADGSIGASVPIRVFGFGAGPRAVGSVAIDKLSAAPLSFQRPKDGETLHLTYSYFLKNSFDIVSEDLWRDCRKLFCPNFFRPRKPFRPAGSRIQVTFDWPVTSKSKSGVYVLKVRAWHNCGKPGNVFAYRLCGDELDWVLATAGPLVINK